MKKYSIFVLVGLLVVSVIMNVDLLMKQNSTPTSKAEVSGAYDQFLIDIRYVQLALDEYLTSTVQDDKTSAMFKLIKMSDAAYHDVEELSRKVYETYGESFPLRSIIFNISHDVYGLSRKNNNTSQLQTMKTQVDSLLSILESNKMIDKESIKKTVTELDEWMLN